MPPTQPEPRPRPTLLERERELRALGAALDTARAGTGSVVVVEGRTGVGKSALLGFQRERAREENVGVLSARASEFEQAYPWGVVCSLFAPALALRGAERDALFAGAGALADVPLGLRRSAMRFAAADEALGAALHGLYWALANLAATGPLLVAVDDAHWADAPSLRWLEYLAARIEDVPALLLLALDPGEAGAEQELVRALAADATTVLSPAPLTPTATARLVEQRLGPDGRIAEACYTGTGGNPFLVNAVLDELSERGGADSELVRDFESPTVARALDMRLARLPPEARDLAAGIAVWGGRARLREAAALARIDDREAAVRAADALTAAGFVNPGEPLEFVQPVIGQIVHASVPPHRRSVWHSRAAELLERAGAPREAIAIHLLAVDPGGDTLLVDVLAEAARDALAAGAPEAAETYLERALAEPPVASQRAGLLRLLGHAEASLHGSRAIEHLRAALEEAGNAGERGRIARELAVPLVHSGHVRQAVAVLERSAAELGDAERELSLELQADLINAGRLHPELRQDALSRARALAEANLRGRTFGERVALAAVAGEADAVLPSAEQAIDYAKRALGGERLLAEGGAESPAYWYAVSALALADSLEHAHAAVDAALADARRKGSKLGSALAYCFRALLEYRAGRLPEAESDSRHAIEMAPSTRWAARAYALAFMIDVLLDRGRPDEARTIVAESGAPESAPPLLPYLVLRQNRGRLRIRLGDVEAGRADMGAAAKGFGDGSFGPCVWPWRSLHAVELARQGHVEEGRRLAQEEAALAGSFGAPRAEGVALRAVGVVEGGEVGIEWLRRAVRVLADSPAVLEHARALIDLGALLRREGHRAEALARLREGLDLAHRCAAAALTEAARMELVMAGARPRRDAARGPDSLTAGELRVARMAGEGLTNREIAQALYVSLRTVETHLTHVYRKLEIRSRDELPGELPADG